MDPRKDITVIFFLNISILGYFHHYCCKFISPVRESHVAYKCTWQLGGIKVVSHILLF